MQDWSGMIIHFITVLLFSERPLIPGIYEPRANIIQDVYLRFYTGVTTNDYVDIQLQHSEELLRRAEFNKDKTTVIYAHGFIETSQSPSVQTVVSSYLEARPDVNVVLLDWSNMAFGNYISNTVPNAYVVAQAAAIEIKKLAVLGLPVANIHLIGHSLGGQLVGFLGRYLQKYNITIKRITALDPAFPMFYLNPFILDHINGSDAEFVDAIHTDVGLYGAYVHTATVDFWPNRGCIIQPGCPLFAPVPFSTDSFCNHWRSWKYWAESVRTPAAFPAVSASSYNAFISENRVPGANPKYIFMGIDANFSSTGDYYLITNASTPFGKGLDGIKTQNL